MASVWLCEQCPFETDDSAKRLEHARQTGHEVMPARESRTHPARPNATALTTGPGALLTDGETLYEVADCAMRTFTVGERTLRVPHRLLRDAQTPLEDHDDEGAWVPISEVMALEVVRPVSYPEKFEDDEAA